MDSLLNTAGTLGVTSVIALYLVWRLTTVWEKKLDKITKLLTLLIEQKKDNKRKSEL